MSLTSASRPERPGVGEDDADVARRQKLAAEIVADGLLTLLLRERLAALDAREAEARAGAEAHAQTSGSRDSVAGRGGSSAVSTSRDESPTVR
jgi:hypothetical protein